LWRLQFAALKITKFNRHLLNREIHCCLRRSSLKAYNEPREYKPNPHITPVASI
jgi:hypothetical protein